MKKITIFTVSLYDDDFLDTPLHQFCIDSWSKYKTHIESQGYECEIKIYNHDDPLVEQFKTECANHLKSKSIAIQTDAFKMFILGKFKNHIWMDCDLYCRDSIIFKDELFFRRAFQYLYNAENTELFESIYKRYCDGEFIEMYDKDVFSKLNIENREPYDGTVHLYMIDNMNNICFTDDERIVNKFIGLGTIALVSPVKIHGTKNLFTYDKDNPEDLKILEMIKSLKGKSIVK